MSVPVSISGLCRGARVFVLCLAGGWIAAPTPAQANTLLNESFESGATGWALLNSVNGLWHLAAGGSCNAVTTMAAYNFPGATCNYSLGAGIVHSGDLVSPPVPLVGSPPFTISYTSRRLIDTGGGDTTVVAIRPVGGSTWTTIGTPAANSGTATLETHPIPSTYLGQTVQFAFRFSADGNGNAGLGWMLDSVMVRNAGAPPLPTVTQLSPNHGPASGLGGVTITGTNFVSTSQVLFGAVPATAFSVLNQTTIIAAAPPQAAGWVGVTVYTLGGLGVLPQAFDYFTPPAAFGASCNGATLVTTGSPTLGSALGIQIQSTLATGHALAVGFSNTAFGGAPLPVALTSLGFPGCFLRVSPDLVIDLGANASIQFVVPNVPALIGLHQYVQGVVLTAVTGLTPGLDLLIGA